MHGMRFLSRFCFFCASNGSYPQSATLREELQNCALPTFPSKIKGEQIATFAVFDFRILIFDIQFQISAIFGCRIFISILIFAFRFSLFAFGCRFSVFGFRFSVFGFRFSGFGFRFSVFGFRFSVFRFRFSIFSFQFSVFGFRFSVFCFRVLNFRFSWSMYDGL
jgi:hypothetical protein